METAEQETSLDLTFVFPCLNEEETLAECVRQVKASLDQSGASYEVIVADNGSTDRSREIAEELGCRVVPVARRGYGAALNAGIKAARGRLVMFADSDMTYLYEDANDLYRAAVKDEADMAIASRMIGKIEPGAMPPLHRYIGTPVLTWLINRLYGGKLTDCNSGFRCVRQEGYLNWEVRSSGMEFASELLIKALKSGARTVEIPSGLRKGPEHRVAHLRTWRDGMRHLLFILSEKPSLFEWLGLVLAVPTSLLQVLAVLVGPISVGPFSIFDLHTQALLLLVSIFGIQCYLLGCSLYLREGDAPLPVTRRLIHMDEGSLFFLLLGVLLGAGVLAAMLVIAWAKAGFSGLHHTNQLLAAVHLLGGGGMMAAGLLSVHMLKRRSNWEVGGP